MHMRWSIYILTCCLLVPAACPHAVAQEQSLDDLFPQDRILDIRITVDEDDWDEIRHQTRTLLDILPPSRQFEPIDSPYTWARARVTIDGVTYPQVGLRKKGFLGSQDTERPSLKIKLDRYDKDMTIGGLDNLTLNNNKQDRSLMSQFMGYAIFNAAGSPAPRCAFAKVTVNGRNLGIYCHVETIREPLLELAFGNSAGTLYEASVVDFFEDWEMSFERKVGRDTPGREHIVRLINALNLEVGGKLDEETIWQLVDEDAFYTFWAVEGLLSFWDGYSGNRNNFFIYLNPATSKLHFIPWGADCMFEKYSQLGEDPRSPRSVRIQGLLANRLYEIPAVRARYARTMRALLTAHWNDEELLAETERIEEMVSPHLMRSQRRSVDFDAIRKFIRNRRSDIEQEVYDEEMPRWAFTPEVPPVIGGSLLSKKGDDFWSAAKIGDISALKEFLAEGVDVNKLSAAGSALGLAALTGRIDAMHLLIEYGADVNISNDDGNTPLHAAGFYGQVDAIQLLLEAGATPNPRNKNGETPFDSAAAPWSDELQGIAQFVAVILEINVDMRDIKDGRPKAATLLRRHGGKSSRALPKAQGHGIWNAAKNGELTTLEKGLIAGADPNGRDGMDMTPLGWAAMAGHIDAAQLLIMHGAKVSGKYGDGGTPLHGATFFGQHEMVKLLIEMGAHVNAKDEDGQTPLDIITSLAPEQLQGILLWIGGLLELDVDVTRVKAAWPEIAKTLRRHGR